MRMPANYLHNDEEIRLGQVTGLGRGPSHSLSLPRMATLLTDRVPRPCWVRLVSHTLRRRMGAGPSAWPDHLGSPHFRRGPSCDRARRFAAWKGSGWLSQVSSPQGRQVRW